MGLNLKSLGNTKNIKKALNYGITEVPCIHSISFPPRVWKTTPSVSRNSLPMFSLAHDSKFHIIYVLYYYC